MKIYDVQGVELTAPDMELGYTLPGTHLVAHHEAVEAKAAVYEWEVLAGTEHLHPGGLRHLVDKEPAVPAAEAWDEYEECLIYHTYTAQELAERSAPTLEERLSAMEGALLELMLIGSAVVQDVTEDTEVTGDV